MVSYIPMYEDIYDGNVEEILYTSRILRENFKRMNTKEDHVNQDSDITVLLLLWIHYKRQ